MNYNIYESEEPLLNKDTSNYTLFPIKYNDIWSMYKKQVDCFWRAEEIDLSKDIDHYNHKLTDDERYFVNMILAFFSSSDGIVMENINLNFINIFTPPEINCFYSFQSSMENIHSETYSLLIETYVKDEYEKMKLFDAINNFKCIENKANWCFKYMNDKSNIATKLIAFACVEGIFFSGAFCSIYWLKKRGLMPGLTFSNELISRDEALHTEFAILLYSKLINKLNEYEIQQIVMEAVQLEQEFICDALPCRLIGMNSDLMMRYIEFVADRLLTQLNCRKIYNTANPFDFMELISVEGKTNFFEKRVGDYALANKEKDDSCFDMNDDIF